MKKNKNFLKYLICILIILICAFQCISVVFENDLFFDIKTGESILKYGIDFRDHFSFIPNLIYIYHHWFYDLIIYGFYNFFGFGGIFVLFLFIFSIFGITVFYVNYKRTNTIVALLVSLFSLYTCSIAFTSRVQSITYILFYLEVYFWEKLYETGEKKYSIILIINSILVVNLHMPMWIVYLVLCLPYVMETLLYLLEQKNVKFKGVFDIEHPNNCKIIFITFFVLIFTGFVSPLKLYPYTFFTLSLFNSSFNGISEMKRTVLLNCNEELFLFLIVLIFSYLKVVKLKLRDFLLVVGLFIFSLIAYRNTSFFLIIIPTIFVKSFIIKCKFNFTVSKEIKLNLFGVIFSGFLIGIYVFNFYNFFDSSPNYGVFGEYPNELVAYIKDNIDYKNVKIYNDFDYGSFLEFNDIPVFIDSRAEVYIKEFNGGYDIMGDYSDCQNFSKYKEIFDKYDFSYAIVYHNNPLYDYLIADKDFEVIMVENDFLKYSLFQKVSSK